MEKDKNVLVWVLVGVALLFLFGNFGIGRYGWWGFAMGFGFLCMLLFWGALIWIVAALVKSSQSGKMEEDPLKILKNRYASGEISKKQYQEMKKELK